jgi:hypothetical protein
VRKILLLLIIALAVTVFLPVAGSGHFPDSPIASPQTPADDGCTLPFNGSARKAVKLRSPDLNYVKFKNGKAISVADFLQYVCTLTSEVTHPVPATQPMNIEKMTMKIRGFVMAMKRDPDNDFHIQIADSPSPYKQTQIIVEVPPNGDILRIRAIRDDEAVSRRLWKGQAYNFLQVH